MASIIVQISPAFAVFEVAQLFLAQRYIGIKQIRSNVHPLDGAAPSGLLAVAWLVAMLVDYAYQVLLLAQPELGVKVAAALLILVSIGGFALRRVCGLRWGLVVFTPECAARAGFFMFIFNLMVLHEKNHLYGLYWLYDSPHF